MIVNIYQLESKDTPTATGSSECLLSFGLRIMRRRDRRKDDTLSLFFFGRSMDADIRRLTSMELKSMENLIHLPICDNVTK